MYRSIASTLFVSVLTLAARAQVIGAPDDKTFEISPTSPPVPALKYQLLFDNLSDRLPGNAALLYHDAILTMGNDVPDKVAKALEAYNTKDMQTFNTIMDSFSTDSIFTELELAGRCESCDWQIPFRERGALTLLPHLSAIARGLSNTIQTRAIRQLMDNKPEEAIKTLRLGYEMAYKTSQEPTLISTLVALRTHHAMNLTLMDLMNRPDAPNLYWALAELPECKTLLRHAFDGQRLGWAVAAPYHDRLIAGEELTVDQWHEVFDYLNHIRAISNAVGQAPNPITDAPPELLAAARQAHVQKRHLPADQAAKIDPTIALGDYYFDQYIIARDELCKLRSLPYPELLSRSAAYDRWVTQQAAQQPTNPFMAAPDTIHKAILNIAKIERELSAMITIEALRSYAAANGKLPAKLQDITETPAPRNPMTGEWFDYHVEGDTAILGDSTSESPFTYTIKRRK
jgi:hypothetical protein